MPDYRPDIDGLRAIAVLLVVLFHLDVAPFTGGFVGVDVFFVISGFLITRIIVNETREAGHCDLARFYARRARRILPALFCTMVLTAVGAFLLLPPDDFERFGGSVLFSALNLANVFFWSGNAYFDDAAARPLLHLWSLGVEEQFYLLWPLALVFLTRRSPRALAFGLLAMGAASLGLSGWVLNGGAVPQLVAWVPSMADRMGDGPATAFYLMPFRIVEFVIGAVMVWLVETRPRRAVVLELLLLLGMTLMVVAAIRFSDETPFPYVNALVPCAGAALVIYAGTAPVTGWLLRNRVAVALGLRSYSIYLLHWPAIALYRAYTFSDVASVEKVALSIAIVGGAALMYRVVERPFRRGAPAGWTNAATLGISVLAALVLAVPAASAWTQGGWAWRLPEPRLARSNDQWRAVEYGYCRQTNPRLPAALVTCQNFRGQAQNIFIWGDSHARHLVPGFSAAYPASNVYVFFLAGCVPQSGFAGYVNGTDECVARNREALDFLRRQPAATVVLSSAKRGAPEAVVAPTVYLLDQLRSAGHTAIILSDVIRPGKSLISCRSVPDWVVPDSALADRCAPDTRAVKRELDFSARLTAALPEVVDVSAVQCPGRRCRFDLEDGTPMFRDIHHLTTAGSIWLISQLQGILPIPKDEH